MGFLAKKPVIFKSLLNGIRRKQFNIYVNNIYIYKCSDDLLDKHLKVVVIGRG